MWRVAVKQCGAKLMGVCVHGVVHFLCIWEAALPVVAVAISVSAAALRRLARREVGLQARSTGAAAQAQRYVYTRNEYLAGSTVAAIRENIAKYREGTL